ncbi:hypothetical protein [Rubripirellula lacrimiformis]|nr:hypothetical protein [Rubripirellula lacrimiformis]
MTATTLLSPVQLHAIAQVAKGASKVRDELTVGNHRPEFTAMFRGELTVGDRQPASSTSAFNSEQLIAWLLDQLGPRKRVQVVNALVAATKEVTKAKPLPVDEKTLQLTSRLIRETSTTSSGTKRGNVAGKIVCELL